MKAEPLKLCGLLAACLLVSAALYFGALWATGLKLRSLIHR
jgi:putative peptidoglycan lipid II flippase